MELSIRIDPLSNDNDDSNNNNSSNNNHSSLNNVHSNNINNINNTPTIPTTNNPFVPWNPTTTTTTTTTSNTSPSNIYPSSHFNTVLNFSLDNNSNNNSNSNGGVSLDEQPQQQQQQHQGRLSHLSHQFNQISSRTNSIVNQFIHNATNRVIQNHNNNIENTTDTFDSNNENNDDPHGFYNRSSNNNNSNNSNNSGNGLLNTNRFSNLISNDFRARLQLQQLHQQLQQLEQDADADDRQDQQQDQNQQQQQQQQQQDGNISNASTRVDIPMVLKWFEQNLMFLSLLSVIFIYVHKQGILVFLWQQIIFFQSNQTLQKQVSLQEKRNVGVLFWLILILSSNVLTTYLFFSTHELWRSLVFLAPLIEFDIWSTFWVVTVNDFVCRFVTMIVKSVCVIVVGHKPPFKRRAQLYAAIEAVSFLYRMLIPTSVWVCYIRGLALNGEYMFSVTVMVLYLSFKLNTLFHNTRVTILIVRAYLLSHTLYGKKASAEQVAESGDHCSICQEKMVSPIVLRCNHIFCEDCVSQWFEREKTCPLCRSPIQAAGHRTHSDGSTSLLLQLF
ncbi:hypothetical protein CYY_001764 [Polysphondylium violaceum]|uniref:RING-type domain-containing protein n=1 Tax=Polysphondylium violaceum TaxID=133409 RepID=A0A8J4PZK6_9MYCE|nr:hypothetical protein CYY_001764 [Polysphondylium violaceum]